MKILILGGTGLISRAIVQAGLDAGHEVITFNRGSRKLGFEDRITTIQGDRKNAADFAEKMRGLQVDVAIDMIAFDAADARQTLEVLGDKAGQLIFTSSIAAYDRPYHSLPIREEAESLRTDPSFAYGYLKAEMERYLQSAMRSQKTPITIIRPSLTFGVGAGNIGMLRQNCNILHRIRAGKPLVMLGEGTLPWSFTFAGDLAKGYILCCGNEKTYNEAFHITNTEMVLWEDLYRAIGEAAGIAPQFCYLPSALLCAAKPDLFAHFYYEKRYASVFSNEKFLAAAPDYRPTITLRQGMAEIVRWWDAACTPDPEKDRLEDALCEAYERFAQEVCHAAKP